MLIFLLNSRIPLVRSSSELIVRRTGKASRSIPCPSIVTKRESTPNCEAQAASEQLKSQDKDLWNHMFRKRMWDTRSSDYHVIGESVKRTTRKGCCSHETLLHFGLQSSHLNICYYHQDLHQELFYSGSRQELHNKPPRPPTFCSIM